ncbi:MAG: hypothetical protein AB1649_08005 [Chloroflexota bacterium]
MVHSDVAARPGNLRIPACSADWRFLLPIGAQSSVLVVTPDCDEFALSLDAINVRNTTQRFDDFIARLGRAASQDVIAFPLGIPTGFSAVDEARFEAFLENALELLRPGGAVLFGFANRWGLRGRKRKDAPLPSTPGEMKRLLISVGYSSAVEIYCAFPNLQTPEYIFSPHATDLRFMLRRRYRHKLPGFFVNLISSPLPTRLILRAVPFYYAVAYRARRSTPRLP